MALLTVEQAAKRLNRTVRTVNRWVEKGELKKSDIKSPTHPLKNFIDEQEVERKLEELAQFEIPGTSSEQEQNTGSLLERVNQLEQELRHLSDSGGTDYAVINSLERRLDTFEDRLDAIERMLSERTLAQASAATTTSTRTPRAAATIERPASIPEDAIDYIPFGKRHGIPDSTFKGQIDTGKVPAIKTPKPNREGEFERWLTPEYQRAAIAFWTQNKKSQGKYHPCDVPGCPCQDTSSLEQMTPES